MAAGCHPEPVTPSADLSPPRRPIFFPVVIATVFLTILAGTGGFLLHQHQRDQQQADGGGGQPVDQVTESAAPAFQPPGPFCPDEMRDTAAGAGFNSELWQVLKIYTDNDSTYWICQDVAGQLFYQSKTGGIDAPLVEGKNGLFLPNVIRTGDDAYEVEDQKGNRFVVTGDQFELHFADGRKTQRNSARTAG
jgi:hypothetical protein